MDDARYWLVECDRLPAVILHSMLTKYSAEFAMTLLKAPPRGHATAPATERDRPLALCVLYARMGNEDSAAAQIADHLDDVQVCCFSSGCVR